MNKKQKKLRREHLKYIKKLREIREHPNFIKGNIDDLIANEEKKHLIEFNKRKG
mgnify:FL=1|jgi:hypothetical protein